MNSQKKKPRQRNRPKNKANRQTGDASSETENYLKNVEQIMETKFDLQSNAQNQLATSELFETHETLRLIQQKLRAKYLSAQKSAQKDQQQPHEEPEENVATATERTAEIAKEIVTKIPTICAKKPKSKEKSNENESEKDAFIANLQKQMENVMAKGNTDIPQTILGNLQKLFNQEPISDVESSDDEGEYIEYVYKPRQYFLATLCNHCKADLLKEERKLMPCKRCHLTYYCSKEHMKADEEHRQLCYGLKQLADNCGGHVFYKCGDFSSDQFRSYRIVNIRQVETIINRPLNATEQEVLLFPRICSEPRCREYRMEKLIDCENCGQVAYCRDNSKHFPQNHKRWCQPFKLFKELILFQAHFGRLEPSLPTKILRDLPGACSNTRQILHKLNFDMKDPCEYAALSQISTGPLTAWYALKLCDGLKKPTGVLTVHLIGAEIEFEVDVLHKWELFFLHITPAIKELNIVFIGPELNPKNISFDQLKKTKCCRSCRKAERTVHYHFINEVYHVYASAPDFLTPDLVCFFNAGLYRATGYQWEDTWPDTILAAANLKCPMAVTSYTAYEAPLDMTRIVQESNRHLNVVLPPIVNPFASEKPERNFVSDDQAPLMFKNFYCFVVE